ncbi:hypothetical protein B0H13DRAFT_1924041 [Mycena leptocephala]|nr:hypothetical protein B0H13DRAFT_1924041 [Mycena leptocephala]
MADEPSSWSSGGRGTVHQYMIYDTPNRLRTSLESLPSVPSTIAGIPRDSDPSVARFKRVGSLTLLLKLYHAAREKTRWHVKQLCSCLRWRVPLRAVSLQETWHPLPPYLCQGFSQLLRYMNLSEHLVSTFNFAILHSLDTHFVYLLTIKSMPIMINPTPNPAQPNPNPNPKPTAVSHSLLIFFKTTVVHTPTSNPNSPCPFFLSI